MVGEDTLDSKDGCSKRIMRSMVWVSASELMITNA
jgi:hypothetical protein